MNKKMLFRLILIGIIFLIVGFIGIKFIMGNNSNNDVNKIQIIELDTNSKDLTGDYLILTNALYQKALKVSKNLKESTSLFENGKITYNEYYNVVTQSNKQLTYYYLVSLQNKAPETTINVDKDVSYDFYLMRRSSEELLKYLKDKSSLRLSVGNDLLYQAITRQDKTNTLIATSIAQYDINPNGVVIDPTIWDKEYSFIEQNPDLVIFKDLDSTNMSNYAYYLKSVNDSFMLVSWEIQNIYLSKIDYNQGKISTEQLSLNLDKSGYVINTTYSELQLLKAPEGLENLEKDTKSTITLYKDALLEIQKFRMGNDLTHFDNAMLIIEQADLESNRIGEFIYSVRTQYGF